MKKPKTSLLLTELFRTGSELASIPLSTYLTHTPDGDGHPVLFLPGFIAGDYSTYITRKMLDKKGYKTYGWGQGANLGPDQATMDKLCADFEQIYHDHGELVSIVGHSLGGIYARELAKLYPDRVRRIITLGSPINDPENSTHVGELFSYLNPDPALAVEEISKAPPCTATIIYTKQDGIVHWKSCVQPKPPSYIENLEVPGSHTGLIVNPSVLYIMFWRLAAEPFTAS
jgi:pimeloyl-ACP methyl ester carboxylesterase